MLVVSTFRHHAWCRTLPLVSMYASSTNFQTPCSMHNFGNGLISINQVAALSSHPLDAQSTITAEHAASSMNFIHFILYSPLARHCWWPTTPSFFSRLKALSGDSKKQSKDNVILILTGLSKTGSQPESIFQTCSWSVFFKERKWLIIHI